MSTADLASVEQLLAEAKLKSKTYDWNAATRMYHQALRKLKPEQDLKELAEVTGLLAWSQIRAAFQAKTHEEFKAEMQEAADTYQRATELYEKTESEALSKRMRAMNRYATFWITDGVTEKRRLIEDTIALANQAATLVREQGDKSGLLEIYRDLLKYSDEAFFLAPEWKVLREYFDSAAQIGKNILAMLEELPPSETLVESLNIVLRVVYGGAEFVLRPSEYEGSFKETARPVEKIREISTKLATPLGFCLANEAEAYGVGSNERSFMLFEEAVKEIGKTGDALLTGRLLMGALGSSYGVGWREEDVERARELLQKGIDYGSRALKFLEIPLDRQLIADVLGLQSECSRELGLLETEADKKRLRLTEAVELARQGTAYDAYSWAGYGHSLSKALYYLATLTADPVQKIRLLRDAMAIREETVQRADRMSPYAWDRGVSRNYLALIKAELSDLENDPKTKLDLLQSAIPDMQQCLELCAAWVVSPSQKKALANYWEWYGDILLQLNGLAPKAETLQAAIEAYKQAVSYLSELELHSFVGEVSWELARAIDSSGDYKSASETFTKAAEEYRLAAKRVPRAASLFDELASYMKAWALIEEARVRHDNEQYSASGEDYSQAAILLQSTKSWSHLARHYNACSLLERGESLSRSEKEESAIEMFTSSGDAFTSARKELEEKLARTGDPDEKQELDDWKKINDGRLGYCKGRTELEKARLLDKKGQKSESLASYRSASAIFKSLQTQAQSEVSRRELETLVVFCDAWAKMKEAEMKASPELYAAASELFTKAEEVTTKEKFRLLALANASMSKALEFGTRFRRTRDRGLYSEIKRELETSADYYQEAGFENASMWTKATQRLFDALLYLADAEAEKEAKLKTELYHLAEKHLELAARLYRDAGFPSKNEEALKHLQRAREEKELLLLPVEALVENPTVSGASVAPISLIRDQAISSDKYETATIVGNMRVSEKEVKLGSDLTVELEIANVGRTPATLIKLEDISPDGFEIVKEKTSKQIENGHVNMKGKRLGYLESDEVKLTLKADRKGTFQLRPRILFTDEKGSYATCEIEPINVVVTELGISAWLRGSRR